MKKGQESLACFDGPGKKMGLRLYLRRLSLWRQLLPPTAAQGKLNLHMGVKMREEK